MTMTVPVITNANTPKRLVNREEQIKEFRSALERIRVLGSVFQTLYEWYGGPGIGKSMLVRLLMNECKDAKVPHASVDFSLVRNPRASVYKEDVTALVEDLLMGFDDFNTETVRSAIADYRDASSGENGIKQLRRKDVSRAFVGFIEGLTKQNAVALFFDETERADQDWVVPWLEEWIINPLVQNGRCLIVWAGRRKQRWKRFEVRRRAHVQELKVFDKQGTEKLFEENSDFQLAEFSTPVRRLTHGHPYADTVILRQLDYMARAGKPPKKERFSRIEADLLDSLVQRFVEEFAFKDVSEEVANACRVMSLVRQFDVIMLREILTQSVPAFAEYGRSEFGGLLTRLRSTQLVLWDDRRKGYALDPTLRHILGEHICRHRPNFYALVNQIALRVYQDWIERAGDNRGIYIVEELFQQACLNRVSPELSTAKEVDLSLLLKQRIQGYPQRDPDLRAIALDRLYHELEDDSDIARLIGQDGLEKLLRIIRRARVV